MNRRVPLGAVLIRFLPGWSGERGEVLVPEVIARVLIESGYAVEARESLTETGAKGDNGVKRRNPRVLATPEGP